MATTVLPSPDQIYGDTPTPRPANVQVDYRPSPQPEAAIQGAERLNAQVEREGEAYGAGGKALEEFGQDIDKLSQQRAATISQLNLTRAKAYVMQQTTDLQTQISQNPNASLQDWNNGFQKITVQAKQLVPLDNDAQNEFDSSLMDVNARGTADIKKQVYDQQSSTLRGQLATDQDATIKSIVPDLANGNWPNVAAKLQNHAAMIDDTTATGAISPEQQALLKIKDPQEALEQALRSMPPDQQLKILGPSSQVYGPPAPTYGPPVPGSSSSSAAPDPSITIRGMIDHIEGGYVANDGNSGAPAIYGINAKANPDAYQQATQITDQQGQEAGKQFAAKFYKDEYWDKNNISSLPPGIQAAAFDTYVNHGAGFASKAVAQADGDPAKLIALRAQEYNRLAADDPQKYAADLPGWKNRLDQLSAQSASASGAHLPSSTNNLLNILPPDKLEAIRQEATKSQQVVLEPQIEDAVAEARETGGSSQMPAAQDIVTAFGPDKAKILLDNYQQAATFGKAYQQIKTLPIDQSQSFINAAAPMAGQPGYKEAETSQSALVSAITQRNKQITDDPAGYMAGALPIVKNSYDAYQKNPSDPNAFRAYTTALDNSYDQMKIPQDMRSILPKDVAQSLVTQLTTGDPAKAHETMQGWAQSFGDQYHRVMGDLVAAKLPTQYNVLAAIDDPTKAAALAQSLKAGPKDAKAAIKDVDAKTIDGDIDSSPSMAQLGRSLSMSGDDGSKFASVKDSIKLMAYGLTRAGASPTVAASDAVSSMTAEKYSFGFDHTRLPPDLAGKVQPIADSIVGNLKVGDIEAPEGPTNIGKADQLLYDQDHAALDDAKNGSWVTTPDDNGIMRVDARGYPVQLKGGKTLQLTYDDLRRMPVPVDSSGNMPAAAKPWWSGLLRVGD